VIEYRHGQAIGGKGFEHLGGYVPGGDPNTYYPALWEWLVDDYGVRSVLDVGCGDGQALDWFAGQGCTVYGIDGIEQPEDDRIEQHDFTKGPWKVRGNRIAGAYDLVWCCEFVEHVEEQYVPNFLEAFLASPLVLLTHALPGQGGHHHVNCQADGYWIWQAGKIGYACDLELTHRCRALAAQEDIPEHANYFARSGLVLVESLTSEAKLLLTADAHARDAVLSDLPEG
jgi:hypothetical protein